MTHGRYQGVHGLLVAIYGVLLVFIAIEAKLNSIEKVLVTSMELAFNHDSSSFHVLGAACDGQTCVW